MAVTYQQIADQIDSSLASLRTSRDSLEATDITNLKSDIQASLNATPLADSDTVDVSGLLRERINFSAISTGHRLLGRVNKQHEVSSVVTLGGGSPFTPPQSSALKLWLNADDITGLSDGAALSVVWHDRSGNLDDAFQTTVANRPVYKATAFGGLPCVEFGSSQWLTLLNVINAETFTILARYKKLSSSGFAFPLGGSGVSSQYSQAYLSLIDHNSGEFYVTLNGSWADANSYTSDANIHTGVWQLNPSTQLLTRKDAVEKTKSTTLHDPDGPQYVNWSWVGARGQPYYSSMYLRELAVYNTLLTTSEIQSWESHLSA